MRPYSSRATLPGSEAPPLRSFLSEHSAEYVLVPNLTAQLATAFPRIIPLFFWSTREGNATALEGSGDMGVRVVTAFARRPRISARQPGHVFVKINAELFDYAAVSGAVGMPVLAGVPVVQALHDFFTDAACAWFSVNPLSSSGEVVIEAGSAPQAAANALTEGKPIQPVNARELVALALRARVWTWSEAATHLRACRRALDRGARFPFAAGYRPFHLLLPVP